MYIVEGYPKFGDDTVPVDGWIEFFVYEVVNPALLTISIAFGTPKDSAYPGSPDYYGVTINKVFLSSTSGTLTDGFYEVLYWNGSALTFVAEVDSSRSFITSLGDSKYLIRIAFSDQFNYETQHVIRVDYDGTIQDLQFRTAQRNFYSPAIGDSQSAFETFLYSYNWSANFPSTWVLRNLLMGVIDTRHPILAARRLALMALRREFAFSDIITLSQQIKKGYSLLVFNNVFSPEGLSTIAESLGERGLSLGQKSLVELRTYKDKIPKEWLDPIYNSADFQNLSLNYKVFVPAALVLVAARAVYEGYVV
jgi:hypothetical protein